MNCANKVKNKELKMGKIWNCFFFLSEFYSVFNLKNRILSIIQTKMNVNKGINLGWNIFY